MVTLAMEEKLHLEIHFGLVRDQYMSLTEKSASVAQETFFVLHLQTDFN